MSWSKDPHPIDGEDFYIVESSDGWAIYITDGFIDGECQYYPLNKDIVASLINAINKTAAAGAPWPVYEESSR